MNDENENNLHQNPEDTTLSDDDSLSLETGRPAVASAPGKIMVFVVAGLVFIAIVVKSLFFSSPGVVAENKVAKRHESVVSAQATKATGLAPGELPVPPQNDPIGTYSSQSNPTFGTSGSSGPDLSNLPPPPKGGTTPGGSFSMPNPPIAATAPTTGSLLNPTAPNFTAPIVPNISPPVIVAPTTTALPPPPPPGLSSPPLPEVKTSLPRDEKAQKRIAADGFVAGTGASAKAAPTKGPKASGFVGSDPNSQFANSAIAASHSESASAERIDNLGFTIIQGKIIHAVLETAINSDLPGTLRAIISHDVYAEAGRAILIPKGSRLIGTYNAAVKRGQGRVFIVWTRVIRPDGVTMDVDSPAVDNLGRAGLEGDVDNKYTEMFSTALLTSSLDIGLAAVGQGLFGDDQTTTTNNGANGSTTTQSATGQAMQEAVDNIGSVGKSIVSNTLNLVPTISIDQGTPVNIFVNRELIFPPSVTGNQLYIQ